MSATEGCFDDEIKTNGEKKSLASSWTKMYEFEYHV